MFSAPLAISRLTRLILSGATGDAKRNESEKFQQQQYARAPELLRQTPPRHYTRSTPPEPHTSTPPRLHACSVPSELHSSIPRCLLHVPTRAARLQNSRSLETKRQH